jgi:hypothetical protein
MFTHLGGIALGTVREGASKNMGAVLVSQTFTTVYAADATVTTGVKIPAGAQIIDINIDVTTAFNATVTNTVKIGTTSGGAELVAATDVTALGRHSVLTTGVYSAWMVGTSDITLYSTYNQAGTAASTGAARITVVYAVKNADATIVNPA